MDVSRRVPAASYSNQAFEPEVSIITSPPVYAIGGSCAMYTRNILYNMDEDDGISLNPTPFYKNWKGKKIKVDKAPMKIPRRRSVYICIVVLLVVAVVALGLGLGLGLGLKA